jgi:HSP20 family molecular chaperone IbpA
MSAFDLFNDFRPLFRLLDQPVAPARGNAHGFNSRYGQFAGPAVEFAEEEGKYIVEAELPGVRKEDLKVTVGEGGRALTIAGSRAQRTGAHRETNQDTNAAGATERKGRSRSFY